MAKEQQSRISIEIANRRSELSHYIEGMEALYQRVPEFSHFTRLFDNFNNNHLGYKGHTKHFTDMFQAFARVQATFPGIGNVEGDRVIDALNLGVSVKSEPARRLLSQVVLARMVQRMDGDKRTREGVEKVLPRRAKAEVVAILTDLGIFRAPSEYPVMGEDEHTVAERLDNLQVRDILGAIERGHLTL